MPETWYVLYTSTNKYESIIQSILKKVDPTCKVWIPKITTELICGEKKLSSSQPIFDDYLFVNRIAPSLEAYFAREFNQYDVPLFTVLRTGKTLATLTEGDIQRIRGRISYVRKTTIQVGGEVVVNHPLVQLGGKIRSIEDDIIEIEVSIFGRPVFIFYTLTTLYANFSKAQMNEVQFVK
jgi:transcription antitermination factor NusG